MHASRPEAFLVCILEIAAQLANILVFEDFKGPKCILFTISIGQSPGYSVDSLYKSQHYYESDISPFFLQ